MSDVKCVKIRMEYSDGTVRESRSAEDAHAILEHYYGLEALSYAHGGRYTGPVLQLVPPPSLDEDDGPGTPSYRLDWLGSELKKRGEVFTASSSTENTPESKALALIDSLRAIHQTFLLLRSNPTSGRRKIPAPRISVSD